MRRGEDQGLVALTSETSRVYLLVTGVGLITDSFQVLIHFVCATGDITTGPKSGCRATVILPGAAIRSLDGVEFQG